MGLAAGVQSVQYNLTFVSKVLTMLEEVDVVKGHIVNLYDVSCYLYACRTSLNLPMCCAAHIVKLTIRTVPATVCFRAGQGQRLCTHLAITWVEEGVATNFTP